MKGIHDLQAEYEETYGEGANYIPPVALTYWSFRGMVGSGFLMLALAALGLYFVVKDRFASQRRFLQALVLAIFLPYLANTTGWLLTKWAGGRGSCSSSSAPGRISPNVSTIMVALSLVLFTCMAC